MSVTDEELMAYADGELSGEAAARVEVAIAGNPALSARLEAARRLQGTLRGHLDPIAAEPVPDALTAMIAAAREDDAKIVSLTDARARREVKAPPRPLLQRWSGFAIAASLVVGLMLGTQLRSGGVIGEKNGALVASGDLAKGLDTQLASASDDGAGLRILTSFRREGGDYCRVFASGATAGIACKDEGDWVLERTTASGATDGTGQAGAYRQAGSVQSELMAAAQDMAVGDPLNAAQEHAAKADGWGK